MDALGLIGIGPKVLKMAEIQVDSATITLAGVLAVLFAIHFLFFRPPASLTHPLLLGRQGESSPMRKKGETPVWMNSMSVGRFLSARPHYSVKVVSDLLKDPKRRSQVQEYVNVLRSGLGSDEGVKVYAVHTSDPEGAYLYQLDALQSG